MIPKGKEEQPGEPAAKKFQNLDKLTITLNELQFMQVQRSEMVKLRVFSGNDNATLLLRNMNKSVKRGEIGQLNMELDFERFIEILNPNLKVVFSASNVLAPFAASALLKENIFSVNEPLSEAIRRGSEKS